MSSTHLEKRYITLPVVVNIFSKPLIIVGGNVKSFFTFLLPEDELFVSLG